MSDKNLRDIKKYAKNLWGFKMSGKNFMGVKLFLKNVRGVKNFAKSLIFDKILKVVKNFPEKIRGSEIFWQLSKIVARTVNPC